MAILVTTSVHGQTQQGYDLILADLRQIVVAAPGFVLHASHPTDEGWRAIEVWQSKQEADHFFAQCVAPNLSSAVRPKRTYQELHSLVTPSDTPTVVGSP